MKEVAIKHEILPLLPQEGGVYFLYGDPVVEIVAMDLAASYLMTGKRVFWVDGGNSFNPYALTEAAKRLNINPHPLLKRLFVARAFTVYQLGALIARRLKPAIERYPDALGVIYDPLALCMDQDVSRGEVVRVLRQITSDIRHLREKGYRLIVVIPRQAIGLAGFRIKGRDNLINILSSSATRMITISRDDTGIRLIEGKEVN